MEDDAIKRRENHKDETEAANWRRRREEKRIEDEDEVCFLRAKRVLLGSGLTQLRTGF